MFQPLTWHGRLKNLIAFCFCVFNIKNLVGFIFLQSKWNWEFTLSSSKEYRTVASLKVSEAVYSSLMRERDVSSTIPLFSLDYILNTKPSILVQILGNVNTNSFGFSISLLFATLSHLVLYFLVCELLILLIFFFS